MISSVIYKGLIKKPLFLGGEKTVVILNGMAGFMLVLIFRNVLSAIVVFAAMAAIHKLINYTNSKEPQFFEMLFKFRKQNKYYRDKSGIYSSVKKRWRAKR